MFLATILICGLTGNSPALTEGCSFISSVKPFNTVEECEKNVGMHSVNLRLPEGAYIVDTKCFIVEKDV